jgi:chromosome segregation ATPase
MAGQVTWNAHPHLAWAMWGLDEIEAALAAFEGHIHKPAADRNKAQRAVAEIRGARDAFRHSIDEHGQDQAALARRKADLVRQWAFFEHSLQHYMDTVGDQVTEQEAVFRARVQAQSKAWQQTIADLQQRATSLAGERRGALGAAMELLESEADIAKAKLDALNKAEGASWAAMKSALTETRAALERAHRAVVHALERAA